MGHVLGYISTASIDLDYQGIINILSDSLNNNNANGIRGILIFSSGHFFQILEGKKEDIQTLFHEKIKKDSRHKDITIITENESFKESHDFYLVDFMESRFTIDPLRARMYYDYLKTLDPHIREPILKTLEQIIPNT